MNEETAFLWGCYLTQKDIFLEKTDHRKHSGTHNNIIKRNIITSLLTKL